VSAPAPQPAAPSPEEVVRGFLLDVRSGERLDRADRYLAPQVRAHQGRPGEVHAIVTRSPDEYVEHVREMLRAAGPWSFEVTGLTRSGDLVEATWRQVGPLGEAGGRAQPVTQHGWAGYLVRAGRITEYWIATSHEDPGGRPVGRAGVDVPDHRGRTGLDRAGRDLRRNPRVVVRHVELLAAGWHVLRRTTFDYQDAEGRWSRQQRETYDRGNGATILLYDLQRRTVLLSRQFRYPAYVNDHPDGMLVEAAAGLLDDDDPESAIRRETAEELGVDVGELTEVFTVYMSPGSVTEKLHFYAAPYTATARTGPGGGVRAEGEDIEVVELAFDDALAKVRSGEIADAKTILLLQWAALEGPFRPGRAGLPR
jgi:nudix-type nucleoside diphosphatase (YffH/AdpP family)